MRFRDTIPASRPRAALPNPHCRSSVCPDHGCLTPIRCKREAEAIAAAMQAEAEAGEAQGDDADPFAGAAREGKRIAQLIAALIVAAVLTPFIVEIAR